MEQILHGSAKATHAIRGELQRSQASFACLAKRYGINEKTVLKWHHRQSVEDMPMGPKHLVAHSACRHITRLRRAVARAPLLVIRLRVSVSA